MIRLAWLNAIVHVIGLCLAATVMKGPYLDHRPGQAGLAWQLSWAWWIGAAFVLLLLMMSLAKRRPTKAALVAVVLAALAFALDLAADLQWMFRYPEDPTEHRHRYLVGAVTANGLYSAAVLFIGLRHKALSLAVFSCGMAFSLSAAFSWRLGTMGFSGATILLYSYWGLVMAKPAPEE